MNSAARAASWTGLKRRALSLGAVKAFDHAMHFLLPVVLTRCLDAATFGEYRLLWLVVGTVMALAPLNMPGGLYFFLPRSDARTKRLYVHQTMLFLAVSGLLFSVVLSPWNALLPPAAHHLAAHGWQVPAFMALWVTTIMLDYLPTIDERIRWQAYVTGSFTVARTALVAVAAWYSGDMAMILWALLAVALFKLALLLYYVRRHHGLGKPWFDRALFVAQVRHTAPIGGSTALYSLRSQADQWVAASVFALSSFAAFSIAAIVGQVVHILRQSVLEAFMPTMSRVHASGDVRGMLAINSHNNVMVGALIYPALGLVFAFAEELVTIVYTSAYVEAAPVMRLYIVALLAMVVEVGSMVLLLKLGSYTLRLAAFTLALSVTVSWIGAHHLGLPGAALGSVIAIYIDRVLLLRRIARVTGIALRELQDWGALARSFALAAACSALAWFLVERVLAQAGPMTRVAAGATLIALLYAPLQFRRRKG